MPIIIILLVIIIGILAPGVLLAPLALIGAFLYDMFSFLSFLLHPATWVAGFIFFILCMIVKGIAHLFKSDETAPVAKKPIQTAPETTQLTDKERRMLQVECAQHNATKVLSYLQSLKAPDERYYAYKSCFQDGKWEGILKESDFHLDPDLPQPDNEEVSPDNNPFCAGVKVRINGGNLDGQVGIVSTGEVIDDQIIVLLDHFGKKIDAAIPVANCQLDPDLPQT